MAIQLCEYCNLCWFWPKVLSFEILFPKINWNLQTQCILKVLKACVIMCNNSFIVKNRRTVHVLTKSLWCPTSFCIHQNAKFKDNLWVHFLSYKCPWFPGRCWKAWFLRRFFVIWLLLILFPVLCSTLFE